MHAFAIYIQGSSLQIPFIILLLLLFNSQICLLSKEAGSKIETMHAAQLPQTAEFDSWNSSAKHTLVLPKLFKTQSQFYAQIKNSYTFKSNVLHQTAVVAFLLCLNLQTILFPRVNLSQYLSISGTEKNKSFLWYFMFLLFQRLKKQNKVDQVKPVNKLYSYLRKKNYIKRKFWKDKVKLCDNCICYIVICTEKQLTASCKLMSSCTIL